jgi:hypothetical protein
MAGRGERKLLDECKSNGSIRIVAGASGEDQQAGCELFTEVLLEGDCAGGVQLKIRR